MFHQRRCVEKKKNTDSKLLVNIDERPTLREAVDGSSTREVHID